MATSDDLLQVFLVDDDVNICRTLSVSLKSLGCQVTMAHPCRKPQKFFNLIHSIWS